MRSLLDRAPEAAAAYGALNRKDFSTIAASSTEEVRLICCICSKHFSKQAKSVANVSLSRCSGCRFTVPAGDSLLERAPELAKELIEADPKALWYLAQLKVSWRCGTHGAWRASPQSRMLGKRCSKCFGRKQMHSAGLAESHPELVLEWAVSNRLKPSDLSRGSHTKIWWCCAEGHRWEASVGSRTSGSGCPKCSMSRSASRGELSLGVWLQNQQLQFVTHSRSIIAPYELDFYFKDRSRAIEFNGDYWHSDAITLQRHGLSSESFHRKKLQLASAQGVKLAFVWESQWGAQRELLESCLLQFLRSGLLAPELQLLEPPKD